MKKGNSIITGISQIATPLGHVALRGREMENISVIPDAAIVITDGLITYTGSQKDMPQPVDLQNYTCIDAGGCAVVPGFVDSHTHLVFGGYREEEFSWRMRGDSYMSIMERGGGIHSTMNSTRTATEAELLDSSIKRLRELLSMGVTTVEAKSGYGMDLETELCQLRVARKADSLQPVDIVSTFMGAHSLPKEYAGRESEFIDFLIQGPMKRAREENLAECCDIFCEKGVFSTAESRRYLEAAKSYGFNAKVHADEIVDTGGARMAAEIGALSADHLLKVSDDDIVALSQSATVATLLPLTAFCLREEYAPARKLIDAGCAVALATDLNPGSCFSASIPLIYGLACIHMGMSPEETLTALTLNGAAALGRAQSIGSIEVGKQADLLILDYPSYKFFPYHTAMNIVRTIVKDGIAYHNETTIYDK